MTAPSSSRGIHEDPNDLASTRRESGKRVLISGLGIAGPALAFWLVQHGYEPVIVERASEPRTGGYMIDFWGTGYEVAERMNVLPTLRRDAYDLHEVRIVNESGRRVAGFDARVFDAASGGRFLSLLRGDLAYRLYEALEGRVEIIFGDSITSIGETADGVDVAFEREAPRRFDIVAGADGLHSRVRALAFGDTHAGQHFLGYYVSAFTAERYPHRDEGVYVSYAVKGGQIARYALRGGRSAFLFVFTAEDRGPSAHLDPDAARRLVRERFARAGWESDEILDAMDQADDFYFDDVEQVRIPAWSRGRVVLVGDAAYCPSLLAGQGSSFALAGAYLLAHALAKHSGDHRGAFEEYERSFRPFVEGKQRAAERFAAWFAPRSSFGITARNLMTHLFNVPVVGQFMAKRSFGDRFELP